MCLWRLEHGKIDLGLEFQKRQEEINTERYPYLGEHRVLRGAQEGLHLEVLLDPLEKQLYLPALLVQIGNGLRAQVIGVGDEAQLFASLGVTVADHAEGVGNLAKDNLPIFADAFRLAACAFLAVGDHGI